MRNITEGNTELDALIWFKYTAANKTHKNEFSFGTMTIKRKSV